MSSWAEALGQGMTSADMGRVLTILDREIASSELLMSLAPIRLLASGPAVAVRLCQNRESCIEIICMLDPNLSENQEYAAEFQAMIETVAEDINLPKGWLINRNIDGFALPYKRRDLFLESVDLGVPFFEGTNLQIFAVRHDWTLEDKVHTISYSRNRELTGDDDVSDAAGIIHQMKGPGGPPLTFKYVRELNFNEFPKKPTDAALKEIAAYYKREYGEVGLAESTEG